MDTPHRATEPVGYSLPLSPSGLSSMITPPPWHFTGDVVMVDYRVDPAAAERFLPPGLSLGADPGAAAAVFADWQWCSDSGAELAEPARCQFGEFLIFLACEYRGAPMVRCPYAWVDQPVPMARGWIQGMPKQLGVVHQTRPRPLGRAGAPLTGGSRFDGVLSVFGHRTARASVTLAERTETRPPLHDVPLAHTRLFPGWLPEEKPLADLVASEVTDVEFGEIWTGEATLDLSAGGMDQDFASLAPVEVGAGHVFGYAETLRGGRLLD